MNKEFTEQIQGRVVDLLKNISSDLRISSDGLCSEVSRLVGCWVLDEYPKCKAAVYIGKFSDGTAHDLLVVDDGKGLSIIDPTIWQKFPGSESILVGTVRDTQEVFKLLCAKYGGVWKVSEEVNNPDDNYREEQMSVIRKNYY